MNFLLKNLELSLEETHLLVGEKLLDDQKMTSLYESERNLWVAAIDGFEIEMQITPSRVKACSCECEVFIRGKMCGHIAAGLLALRKQISENKNELAGQRSKNKTYQKLTVNAILDQVGGDELSSFIRHYARGNRNFSIALKTRFAGSVAMFDNTEKYRQVISSVVKSSRNKNDRISAPGAKQILATAVDLLGQSTDSIALEHYIDCWSVLQVLVEKVVPVVNRSDFETDRFLQFSKDCFDLLHQLIERPIPPSLKIEIWEFLLEMASRQTYRGYDLIIFIFKLLLSLADGKAKSEVLLKLVDKELNRRHTLSAEYKKQLVATKLSILKKKGFSKAFKAYTLEVLASPDRVLFTVSAAIEMGMPKIAKMLGIKGLSISNHHLYLYRLKITLLDIAVREEDTENIVSYANDCFIETGNIKFLRLCRQYFKGDWEAFVNKLAMDIQSGNSLRKKEYLANLYGEEKRIPELVDLLIEEGSVDFLMKYDSHFIIDHQNELQGVYVQLLNEYFSTHLGIKPTQKMLTIFAHLRKLGAHGLVDKLAAFVRQNHPDRLDLALELMMQ